MGVSQVGRGGAGWGKSGHVAKNAPDGHSGQRGSSFCRLPGPNCPSDALVGSLRSADGVPTPPYFE